MLTVSADIRRADDCARIIESAKAEFGRIDVLVNNDGAPPLGLLDEFDDAAWDKAVQQNLMSVVRLSRLALPLDARQQVRTHRQHHGAVGAAADRSLWPVGLDLGRR